MYANKITSKVRRNVVNNFPCEYSQLDNDGRKKNLLFFTRTNPVPETTGLLKSVRKQEKTNVIEIIRFDDREIERKLRLADRSFDWIPYKSNSHKHHRLEVCWPE